MRKIINITSLSLLLLILTFNQAIAKEVPNEGNNKGSNNSKAVNAAGCLPANSSTELNLNNVRARINTGGDMWWDLQGIGQYEIPKGSKKTSMFSASLWMGGLDVNGQLKGAFQRYRGNGNDFWTGPLTDDGKASTTPEVCDEYDKHFVITREEVDEFILKFNNPEYPDYIVPDIIKDWPAHGDVSKNQNFYLAPFYDEDGDGVYNWQNGDYPYYDIDNSLCKPELNANGEYEYEPTMGSDPGILADQVLKGDQTIWWVFNDNGNIHTETKGDAIGVEIRAQAFAFSTNDVINNMTFYSYEIINRSTFRLTETYFSQWVDTDLGNHLDDYVGCDVERGLGYCYNGDNEDGSGNEDEYGLQPPAIGVDFFQGPYMDPDGLDNPKYESQVINGDTVTTQLCDESINGVNFGDGIKDNERFGMRRFVYHNNPGQGGGGSYMYDPDLAIEYYNYLKGIWMDNTRMIYGGLGHVSAGGYGPECDFMFPDETDPCNWGTGGTPPNGPVKWTEESANNPKGDRRFMQSAGPFTLESGAVNYITVGIPWARAASGGPFESVELLRTVDDKCQALFDNCFKVLDGPDAPELTVQELDGKLILYLENIEASNNNNESYSEIDPTISAINPDTATTRYDSTYNFQGYQIFQLANADVSIADIYDPDLSRLVAQCDIKDDIDMIVNYTKDKEIGADVPQIMVDGANEGIQHSFVISEDQFATGDKKLVNHKKYYFIAIAYSYNNYREYTQDPSVIGGLYGQKKPYLAGRKSAIGPIKVITAIPHITDSEGNGTEINAEYGDGPKITRIAGRGNGGNEVKLTETTINEIMENGEVKEIEYDNNYGPIDVKVIDPLNVIGAEYQLYFNVDSTGIDNAGWTLYMDGDSLTSSDTTITVANEQLLLDYGIAITIGQANEPGVEKEEGNGFISADVQYEDSSNVWLSFVPDMDGGVSDLGIAMNWIRSGTFEDQDEANNNDYTPSLTGDTWLDPQSDYEKVLNGTWAPYRLCSKSNYGHGLAQFQTINNASLANLTSVQVVFTPDKSKWTRCPVLESGEDKTLNEGNVQKMRLRAGASIDKDGNQNAGGAPSQNPDDPNYIASRGMGWFPGYAIDLETGRRLNMMYAESSWLVGENGRDMMFNPTSNFSTPLGDVLFGGKHYLYILRESDEPGGMAAYDAGQTLYDLLSSNSFNPPIPQLVPIFQDIIWASIPLAADEDEWLANEISFRLNVTKPYQRYLWGVNESSNVNNDWPAYSFTTNDIATEYNNQEVAESALDIIRAVPNPFQGYSLYGTSQLDNIVKLVNLPETCTIRIYNASGSLVRTFKKDNTLTYLEWDLKNHASIPIASGTYYIHIDAPGIGEKVVKWFGVLRPTDLNSF